MEQAPARQTHRYQVVQVREFPFCLIPFKSLVSTVMVAHIIDISAKGVGIESSQHLEPGFVWFRDRIGGFKGGLLVWSRQAGEEYSRRGQVRATVPGKRTVCSILNLHI